MVNNENKLHRGKYIFPCNRRAERKAESRRVKSRLPGASPLHGKQSRTVRTAGTENRLTAERTKNDGDIRKTEYRQKGQHFNRHPDRVLPALCRHGGMPRLHRQGLERQEHRPPGVPAAVIRHKARLNNKARCLQAGQNKPFAERLLQPHGAVPAVQRGVRVHGGDLRHLHTDRARNARDNHGFRRAGAREYPHARKGQLLRPGRKGAVSRRPSDVRVRQGPDLPRRDKDLRAHSERRYAHRAVHVRRLPR